MYTRVIDKCRISLGRALNRMYTILNIDDVIDSLNGERNEVAFMKVQARTSIGLLKALAVMRPSYAAWLFSERVEERSELSNAQVRRKRRTFFAHNMEGSTLDSVNRAVIPPKMRDYAGIPKYCRVNVVENNGYAAISLDEAISDVEGPSFEISPANPVTSQK